MGEGGSWGKAANIVLAASGLIPAPSHASQRFALKPTLFQSRMYFDLNVPIPQPTQFTAQAQTKKGKGKQPSASTSTAGSLFTPAQITALETRLDLLVQCSSLIKLMISNSR